MVEKLKAIKVAKAAELVADTVEETLAYYRFRFPDGTSCLILTAARLCYLAGKAWPSKRCLTMKPANQPAAMTA